MANLVQLKLFNEPPEIVATSKGEYNDFVAKFGHKKTTDDCYTPDAVYNCVKDWFFNKIPAAKLKFKNIVRPFWPDKDYLTYNYQPGTLVFDNPPFSIYSKIIRNYMKMGVKFFLFAPALSQFVPYSGANYIVCGANITYQNGAIVRTSFTHNIFTPKIIIDNELRQLIHAAQKKPAQTYRPEMPQYFWSSAQLQRFATNPDFKFTSLEATEDFVKYDRRGKKIFGAAIRIGENDNEFLSNI